MLTAALVKVRSGGGTPDQPATPFPRRREDQRLHDDGDGAHVFALIGEIDEIEVGDLDLINRDHVVAGQQLLGKEDSNRPCDVRVEDERQRHPLGDSPGQRSDNPLGERPHSLV